MRSDFHHSIGIQRGTLTMAAGAALFSSFLFLPTSAFAQGHVSLTYLADPVDTGTGQAAVITKTVPVVNNIANISINTDYVADPSVENGSAFIVEPTVDPKVNLQETLYNLSGKTFYDLSFTMPDGLYFKRSDLGSFASTVFSSISLQNPFVLNDPNSPDNGTTVYQTVVFAPLTTQAPLNNGQSGNFDFSFYTPAATNPATPYMLYTIPLTAPEPGSVSLLAAAVFSFALGPAVRGRRRRAS